MPRVTQDDHHCIEVCGRRQPRLFTNQITSKPHKSLSHPLFEMCPPRPCRTNSLFDMTVLDTAFPSTDRDRLLCGLLCDLVAAQPGLPSTAYLDAMVIVLRYKRHRRLLIGSEQTQFVALSGKLPKNCVQSDDRLPWTELIELLAQQEAIRKQNGSTLANGIRLAEVRKAYPNLDPRLIALIHKAAATLRDMQSLAKPKSASDQQVAFRVLR